MANIQLAIFSIILTLLISPVQLLAVEPDHEHHGAHVHGEAQLLIAVEGNTLEIEFISPAMNIVGFEYLPRNNTQLEAVKSAIEILNQPGQLFSLPSGAECHTSTFSVESPFSGHEKHAHGEADHRDFAAHYHFLCTDMSRLKRVEVGIFKQFPATDVIEVQSISQRGQRMTELTPEHNSVEL
ncbi:DUF2796 domain-containing protein [Solemya elarraichensis gill symbiont]|uniref:DUF2796 domain-containing protein n=1 Tax=Solemya elarraichensis gill symbiont TaxID=1918949 RepID=A0A1T2LCH0_9GAMM|nr:DUF2796 domain-containing protein [Solemya elarraichensis gill symbiont]OOZ42798.1 hypothetical protein BOW52_01420 [Solemya elarraichensis gill symbiont]